MMWMAWYEDLQISPNPRRYRNVGAHDPHLCWASAERDKIMWERQHPGKWAEIRECKKKEDGNG